MPTLDPELMRLLGWRPQSEDILREAEIRRAIHAGLAAQRGELFATPARTEAELAAAWSAHLHDPATPLYNRLVGPGGALDLALQLAAGTPTSQATAPSQARMAAPRGAGRSLPRGAALQARTPSAPAPMPEDPAANIRIALSEAGLSSAHIESVMSGTAGPKLYRRARTALTSWLRQQSPPSGYGRTPSTSEAQIADPQDALLRVSDWLGARASTTPEVRAQALNLRNPSTRLKSEAASGTLQRPAAIPEARALNKAEPRLVEKIQRLYTLALRNQETGRPLRADKLLSQAQEQIDRWHALYRPSPATAPPRVGQEPSLPPSLGRHGVGTSLFGEAPGLYTNAAPVRGGAGSPERLASTAKALGFSPQQIERLKARLSEQGGINVEDFARGDQTTLLQEFTNILGQSPAKSPLPIGSPVPMSGARFSGPDAQALLDAAQSLVPNAKQALAGARSYKQAYQQLSTTLGQPMADRIMRAAGFGHIVLPGPKGKDTVHNLGSK